MRRGALGLALLAAAPATGLVAGAPAVTVAQRNRAFAVDHVAIRRGETVRFTNDDEFLHQIYTRSAEFSFDSDEQPSGQVVDLTFPVAGTHQVRCGIHPRMLLRVEVE